MLALGGYVAFNLPRIATSIGAGLLAGVIATHGYLLASTPVVPVYFAAYGIAVIAGCTLAIVLMWLDRNPRLPQAGWLLGTALCCGYAAAYLASRAAVLPGLVALTGRWDIAPGTVALACAAAFVAVHGSVLLGINIAVGQRREWPD